MLPAKQTDASTVQGYSITAIKYITKWLNYNFEHKYNVRNVPQIPILQLVSKCHVGVILEQSNIS